MRGFPYSIPDAAVALRLLSGRENRELVVRLAPFASPSGGGGQHHGVMTNDCADELVDLAGLGRRRSAEP